MALGDIALASIPPIIAKTYVGEFGKGLKESWGAYATRSPKTRQPLNMLFKPHIQFREPE